MSQPDQPCAYCATFGSSELVCECEAFCGTEKCSSHPDRIKAPLTAGEYVVSQPGQDVPRYLHALAFNALSRGLADYDRFVSLTERETITAAILDEILPAHEALVRAKVAEEARQNDGGPEIVQVCMHEVMLPAFKAWLAERDLRLFPIPVDNNLPTYGIRGTS